MNEEPILRGQTPRRLDDKQEAYLYEKLADTRKSCEWLLGLGAVNILGNVLKTDSTRMGDPLLRRVTLIIITLQMLLALFGATTILSTVDASGEADKLQKRLQSRYHIRNASAILLVTAFILLLMQIW